MTARRSRPKRRNSRPGTGTVRLRKERKETRQFVGQHAFLLRDAGFGQRIADKTEEPCRLRRLHADPAGDAADPETGEAKIE